MRLRALGMVLVVASFAGCVRPPVVPVPPASPAPQVRETALQNGFLKIRVELPDGVTTPVPAVISLLGEGDALRRLGIAVVTYELQWGQLGPKKAAPAGPAPTAPAPAAVAPPPPAARTWGKWLLVSPSPDVIGQGYFRLISGNAEVQVPQVLDWLTTLPEIDPTRIGIAGISTNGFKALQATAFDKRLRAAVAIAACGDYHCFLESSSLALNQEEPIDLEPAYEKWLRAREPIRHPKAFVHAAVLMVNGGKDVAVPGACAVETAKVFERAYAAGGVPERFRFVYVEGGGHDLGDEVRYQTLAWLYRWLVAPVVDG
ncbi:MAG TPA: prolyl oligopeptidase family serine peptidase [Candidatus Binatia bacterium]|jgi:hypothetical protein|nr:prolyl oligopeptidase family serine peptidase [Candidatus Binatia bacterium]